MPPSLPDKPASMSTITFFGFSLGMIGDRIFRDAPALLLLLYMTNYLAIPPALAGLAIFIPKIIIIFVDPMVGRTRPGVGGGRRCWLAAFWRASAF